MTTVKPVFKLSPGGHGSVHTGTVNPDSERAKDPRLGDLIVKNKDQEIPTTATVAILGFPSDEGVRRNGGRPGARDGPSAIRRALFKMTPSAREKNTFMELLKGTVDLGDLQLTDDLNSNQETLGQVVATLLGSGTIPIILGGGHETSYGHFLGYARNKTKHSIINFDAHPDVRPLIDGQGHSGSPFRQVLEHESCTCQKYHVLGLNPFAVSASHLEYLEQKSAVYTWLDSLSRDKVSELFERGHEGQVLCTFDLDALNQALAPGVSAPNPAGIGLDLWLHAALQAGLCPGIRSLDIVELNPTHDLDDRTARVAALTIWQFLLGLSRR